MRIRRALFGVLVIAGAIAVPIGAVSDAATDTEPASAPDQLLVGYRRGASEAQRAEARQRADAVLVDRVVEEAADRTAVELVAVRGTTRAESTRRFTSNPTVEFAEPNWLYTHGATSVDPYYANGSLWGMYGDATTPDNQYGSQAGEAWAGGNVGTGTVYVGVIDEGYQYNHPDLQANATQLEPADGVDNDGNGYVDDVHGWDFYNDDASVYDGSGDDHGTHVAGTIGADGDNGIGVAGMAWDVKLVSAKFLGPRGGYLDDAVRAVDYLTNLKTQRGLNIVATNNSWGGGGYSQALFDAIDRADKAGILFVAAAGNGGGDGRGDNNDSVPHYPSSYTNANVISVASITSSGSRSSFSNYGTTSVDLGAPGSGIWSTLPGGSYGSYSGTSMATPHVTGAVVLHRAIDPNATAAQTKAAILDSTIPTSSMSRTVSGGRLNVSGFPGTGGGGGGGGGDTGGDPGGGTGPLDVSVSASCGGGDCTYTATVAPAGTYDYVWSGATGAGNQATAVYSSPGTYGASVTASDADSTGSGTASVTCTWAGKGKKSGLSCS